MNRPYNGNGKRANNWGGARGKLAPNRQTTLMNLRRKQSAPAMQAEGTWRKASIHRITTAGEEEYLEPDHRADIYNYSLREKAAEIASALNRLGRGKVLEPEDALRFAQMFGEPGILFQYIRFIGLPYNRGMYSENRPRVFFDLEENGSEDLEAYFSEYLNAPLTFPGGFDLEEELSGWHPPTFFLHYREPLWEIFKEAQQFARTVDGLMGVPGTSKEEALQNIALRLEYAMPILTIREGHTVLAYNANCPLSAAYMHLLEKDLQGLAPRICVNTDCRSIFYDTDTRKSYCSPGCRNRANAAKNRRGGAAAK